MVVTQVIPMLGGVGAPHGKSQFGGRIFARIIPFKRAQRDLFININNTAKHNLTTPRLLLRGELCCEVHHRHPDLAKAKSPHKGRFCKFQMLSK